MNEQDIIETVYELGYEQGYADARSRTPWFGSAPKDPDDIGCPLDTEGWTEKVRNDISVDDVDNVVYVEVEYGGWATNGHTESFLFNLDTSGDYYSAEHQIKEELDLHIHTYVDVEEDPAATIDALKERLREVTKENNALRATHPGSNDDAKWTEDPADLTGVEKWELEPVMVSTERTVPLKGSHVFDQAVVKYDVQLATPLDGKGKVNTVVDIENIELVSTN